MKICVFTLTRDRLEFTKHCFKTLQEKVGYDFTHFIIDNGSSDGTPSWVINNYATTYPATTLQCLFQNHGIARGMNLVKNVFTQLEWRPDLVIKFDNDCEVVSEGILRRIVSIYENLEDADNWVLSPRVEGLIKPPARFDHFGLENADPKKKCEHVTIGRSHVVGGIFRVVPYKLFMEFTADETLPKAYGVDGQFAQWCMTKGVNMGYIEDLEVRHYLTTKGQMEALPEYFKRKYEEER